jgi:hypothetical protein
MGQRLGGRAKGTPNKTTALIKAAIIEAFELAGGTQYLLSVAREDPKTFCALLSRVLPNGDGSGERGNITNNVLVVAPDKLTVEDWTAKVAEAVRVHGDGVH